MTSRSLGSTRPLWKSFPSPSLRSLKILAPIPIPICSPTTGKKPSTAASASLPIQPQPEESPSSNSISTAQIRWSDPPLPSPISSPATSPCNRLAAETSRCLGISPPPMSAISPSAFKARARSAHPSLTNTPRKPSKPPATKTPSTSETPAPPANSGASDWNSTGVRPIDRLYILRFHRHRFLMSNNLNLCPAGVRCCC